MTRYEIIIVDESGRERSGGIFLDNHYKDASDCLRDIQLQTREYAFIWDYLLKARRVTRKFDGTETY